MPAGEHGPPAAKVACPHCTLDAPMLKLAGIYACMETMLVTSPSCQPCLQALLPTLPAHHILHAVRGKCQVWLQPTGQRQLLRLLGPIRMCTWPGGQPLCVPQNVSGGDRRRARSPAPLPPCAACSAEGGPPRLARCELTATRAGCKPHAAWRILPAKQRQTAAKATQLWTSPRSTACARHRWAVAHASRWGARRAAEGAVGMPRRQCAVVNRHLKCSY